MTILEIKDAIISFSKDQKKVFNQSAETKIYNESSATITTAEQTEVDDTIIAIADLSNSELDNLIEALPKGVFMIAVYTSNGSSVQKLIKQ